MPRKNVKLLAGSPLITYAIESAKRSRTLDKIVVSTDDAEIKSISIVSGLAVIDRPPHLSGSDATTESALIHALDVLGADGEDFDYVSVLEPTSPFRTAKCIDDADKMIVEKDGASLLAVKQSYEVTGTIENGYFRPLVVGEGRRRQERIPKFVEASTLYVCRTDYLRATESLVCDDWLAFVVSPNESIDINEENDFAFAEFLMNRIGQHDNRYS